MEVTVVIAVIAALTHGIAFILYNRTAQNPKAASWAVWAFSAALNALTYRVMSNDLVMTLQFYTGSVACFLTFVYLLARGRFGWPSEGAWASLVLACVALLVWHRLQNATWANMILLVSVGISFIPTFTGALKQHEDEPMLPWALWTAAFVMSSFNVWLRDGNVMSYVTPVALMAMHGSIVCIKCYKFQRIEH